MDIEKLKKRIPRWIQKYRYPILILAVGLVLLMLPTGKTTTQKNEVPSTAAAQIPDTGEKLAQILAQIDGVGKVRVMLAVSVGEKTYYHTDEDTTVSDTSSTVHKETVIITDSNRNQSALITQIVPAQYRGAVVVCQGAGNAAVKLAVVEAVSKATGLGADQISVLKMK